MKNAFEKTLQELYQVFSKYPVKSKMTGCPCCVKEKDKAKLHSKNLRELESEDLSYYAFKAMTTFGDVEDFKHFLPRIFELTGKRRLYIDHFVILGKLEYANWLSWEKEEIRIINKFLYAWWCYDINYNEYFDVEILIELNKFIQDLPKMLNVWCLDVKTQGFRNYVDLIEEYYYDLKGKGKNFKSFKSEDLRFFMTWVDENIYRLEDGFFEYEEIDGEFSGKISEVLFLVEGIGEVVLEFFLEYFVLLIFWCFQKKRFAYFLADS